ncbi:MAG: thiamine phosphate synthase [Rhodothermales bacterium]|nr:thiamine phosphate synthase [Rhodothermales bacterium]MDG2017678.1 thiamine phosphate synthase [Rhodothermales bacterium]
MEPASTQDMMMTKPMNEIGRLHILTDYYFQQRFSHAELAERAILGGADTIQFRQKHGKIRDLLSSLNQVREVCRQAGVPLIVNDRLDLALAVRADGVHLGQTDLPLTSVLEIVEGSMLVGITAPDYAAAHRAESQGASYIGFGPVYATKSKSNPIKVQGLGALRSVADKMTIPVIAIAGITPKRCPDVLSHGAHGVAVMTSVSLSENPEATCRLFAEAIESSLIVR